MILHTLNYEAFIPIKVYSLKWSSHLFEVYLMLLLIIILTNDKAEKCDKHLKILHLNI